MSRKKPSVQIIVKPRHKITDLRYTPMLFIAKNRSEKLGCYSLAILKKNKQTPIETGLMAIWDITGGKI